MVKCKICLEEKGRSNDYEHLHFHLLKKHGIVCRDYRNQFPGALVTSSSFRLKQKKLMLEKRKNIPDLQKKLHAWRQQKEDPDYEDVYKNPTIDDLENIKRREEWCRMMLGSGIKGEEYKRIYKDLMDCRVAIEQLFEQLMRQEEEKL